MNVVKCTTFRTHARARAVVELANTEQLNTLAEQLIGQPFIILGSGSNVLFADDYDGVIVVNALKGMALLSENDNDATIRIAAGENWHNIVCKLSQRGFYGLENLALIPGTMGATPVQNIGAYGVEIADFIASVSVYDLVERTHKDFAPDDCQFGYRDSIFKREENRERYVITAVTLTLSKTFSPVLSYQGLNCGDRKTLTAQTLLERVIALRQSKLPNPDELPNAGSFFKNPVVTRELLNSVQLDYPDVPFFDIDRHHIKIPAAWLIEKVGLKGETRENGAGVYEKHALILVNRGQAHGRDIYALAHDIIQAVYEKFTIEIIPEVRIIGLRMP